MTELKFENKDLELVSKLDISISGFNNENIWIYKISKEGIVTFNPELKPEIGSELAWQLFKEKIDIHNKSIK